MKKINNEKKVFSTVEMILLVLTALFIGLSIGGLLTKAKVVTKQETIKDKYLKEFISNYNYILKNYYEKVDKEDLINNAIAGMMESLDDPYSMYLNEEQTNNFTITLDGSYKGLGVQISKEEETGYIVIAAIFKNSPAAEVDLRPGDKIVSIDEEDASKYTLNEFSSLIKNSKKQSFKLKILRGTEEKILEINKKTVTLTSVVSKIYDEEDKKIGYIYIGIFANNTYKQFKDEIKKLEAEGINSLIIDVRGNSGGHLKSVDGILDLFLNSKQKMYQFKENKKKIPVYGKGSDRKGYQIVLLGNETSASASEVLIAGLRENLNSKFIGKKTYGKGTVQELITLSDGTQYKITTKKWLTPKGNWINDTKGLKPDIEVELDNKYYETYEDKDDAQLQKALEYLRSK